MPTQATTNVPARAPLAAAAVTGAHDPAASRAPGGSDLA
jgi:hypothetical protein